MSVLSSDDEEVSLVIEATGPEVENAENDPHEADHPNDDTLSVGPDMPDLPLDAPLDPESSMPSVSTAEASLPEEVQLTDKETDATAEEEQGTAEDNTVREDPIMHREEGSLAGQQENSGRGEEEEQRAESTIQAEEEIEEKQEIEPKLDTKGSVVSTNNGTALEEVLTQEPITSQEVSEELAQVAAQEVAESGERSCVPCASQSIFSTYSSHAPSRRKNRPCSLPVSELETVIASACGEPETPRSHYIRIHHLFHSLPSAQQRPPSQDEEDEETGEGDNRSIIQDTSTSPMLKTSKEESQDEEEEDTTQSPSQVKQ